MHFYSEKFGFFRSMCVAVLSLRECSKGGEYVQGGVVVRGGDGGGDVVAAGGGAHGAAPRRPTASGSPRSAARRGRYNSLSVSSVHTALV